MVEYQSPNGGARFAEALMPGPNNGGPLVWNLRKANTSNMEFELHLGLLPKEDGTIRLLAYVNNASMGIYRYANEQYLEGRVAQPDISNHPKFQRFATVLGGVVPIYHLEGLTKDLNFTADTLAAILPRQGDQVERCKDQKFEQKSICQMPHRRHSPVRR